MDTHLDLTWCENNTTDFAKSIIFNADMVRITGGKVEVSVDDKTLNELTNYLTEAKIGFSHYKIIENSNMLALKLKSDIFCFNTHRELRVREIL
jgi:hypothetical protein